MSYIVYWIAPPEFVRNHYLFHCFMQEYVTCHHSNTTIGIQSLYRVLLHYSYMYSLYIHYISIYLPTPPRFPPVISVLVDSR